MARTSTFALTSARLPHLVAVAKVGVRGAAAVDPALAKGLFTLDGHLVNQPVAQAHTLSYTDPVELLLA